MKIAVIQPNWDNGNSIVLLGWSCKIFYKKSSGKLSRMARIYIPTKPIKWYHSGKTLAFRLIQRSFCQKGRSLFKNFNIIIRVIRFMHELPRPQRWRLHALPKMQKIWELNHEMLVSRSRMPLSIVTGILVLTSDPPKEDFFSSIIRMALIKKGHCWRLTI